MKTILSKGHQKAYEKCREETLAVGVCVDEIWVNKRRGERACRRRDAMEPEASVTLGGVIIDTAH